MQLRACPPMKQSKSNLLITGPSGTSEVDTLTCCHCQRITPAGAGGYCSLCDDHVCPRCAGRPCSPFEKRLEQVESGQRLLKHL